MKRTLCFVLALWLLLSGCSKVPTAQTDLTADEILRTMLDAIPENSASYTVYDFNAEDSLFMLEVFYELSRADIADSAFAQANGLNAFEAAVFQLVPDADAGSAVQCCLNRLHARAGDFAGYAPEQSALAQNGLVFSCGQWVALVISEDAATAQEAFSACFSEGAVAHAQAPDTSGLPAGRTAYTDPGLDDMTCYDTSAILSAWHSGDISGLSGQDAATLEAARAVLSAAGYPDAAPLEIERGVYNWLCGSVSYDWTHQNSPQKTPRTSFEPYGALVNRTAVCLGFACAFQLLMDMADIPCITVIGAAFQSSENHAWNMVCLDGAWYCADATWDLARRPDDWSYFNVTSDYMAATDHQWDYETVPEAVSPSGKP